MNGYMSPLTPDKNSVKEIDLKEWFVIFKRRIWLILLITVLFTAAGYYYSTLNNTTVYQSSTRMIIGADQELMKTLKVMIEDPMILEKVSENLQLNRSPESLDRQIGVEVLEGSQVVKITAIDTNPTVAVNVVNTTALLFKQEINRILDFQDVRLLAPADANSVLAITPNRNRTIILGAVIGVIVGIGISLFLHSINGTINSSKDVEEWLGYPVLGTVSKVRKKTLRTMVKSGNFTVNTEVRRDPVGTKETY